MATSSQNDEISVQQLRDTVNQFLNDSGSEMIACASTGRGLDLRGESNEGDFEMASAAIKRFPGGGGVEVQDKTLLRLNLGDNLILVLGVDSVTFAPRSAELDANGIRALQSVKTFLAQDAHKEVRFEIQGHTDSTGGTEDNIDLSLRRAQTVQDWLIQEGIAAVRIGTAARGESSPLIEPEETEDDQKVNRRIDLVVQETYSIEKRCDQ